MSVMESKKTHFLRHVPSTAPRTMAYSYNYIFKYIIIGYVTLASCVHHDPPSPPLPSSP